MATNIFPQAASYCRETSPTDEFLSGAFFSGPAFGPIDLLRDWDLFGAKAGKAKKNVFRSMCRFGGQEAALWRELIEKGTQRSFFRCQFIKKWNSWKVNCERVVSWIEKSLQVFNLSEKHFESCKRHAFCNTSQLNGMETQFQVMRSQWHSFSHSPAHLKALQSLLNLLWDDLAQPKMWPETMRAKWRETAWISSFQNEHFEHFHFLLWNKESEARSDKGGWEFFCHALSLFAFPASIATSKWDHQTKMKRHRKSQIKARKRCLYDLFSCYCDKSWVRTKLWGI